MMTTLHIQLYLGCLGANFDEKWIYLEPLIFMTLTFLHFFDKVNFKGIIYPLKYNDCRDHSDLRSDQVRDRTAAT